jgi:uncharacterized protein (DUF2267 family)
MNDLSASLNNHKLPVRLKVVPATDWSGDIQSPPCHIQELARSLARVQEELRIMRQEAIAKVHKAIAVLGSYDRISMPPATKQILSELAGALDEMSSLEIEVLPRPEHFVAIADRLNRLNEKLLEQHTF